MTEVELAEEQAHWREAGAWSLAYLGPGFRAQLRIRRRIHGVRLDGFLTPALPMTVLLVAVQPRAVVAETSVSESGRFEFVAGPVGGARLMFVGPEGGEPFLSPPFWA